MKRRISIYLELASGAQQEKELFDVKTTLDLICQDVREGREDGLEEEDVSEDKDGEEHNREEEEDEMPQAESERTAK